MIAGAWVSERPSLRLLRYALVAIAVALPVGISIVRYIGPMSSGLAEYPPFTDAITYLAAGERLNAGHDLYVLGPGDRLPTTKAPTMSTAPILSPPPIAVVWRPLAALPFGMALWVVASWCALLGAAFVVAVRSLPGLVLVLILSVPIAEALAVGNVVTFFPAAMLLAWRTGSGSAIAAMASLKLTPATLLGWMPAKGVRGLVAGGVVIAIATVVGAGWNSILEYVDVARTVNGSASSLSGMSGIPWLSPAILVAGTLAAFALRRWSGASFIVAVAASIIGSPSLFLGHLAGLIAVAAPMTMRRDEG